MGSNEQRMRFLLDGTSGAAIPGAAAAATGLAEEVGVQALQKGGRRLEAEKTLERGAP